MPTESSLRPGSQLFPPALAAQLARILPSHTLLNRMGSAFGEILNAVFFASLQTEEGTRPAIRVAIAGDELTELKAPPGSRVQRFRSPCAASARNLLRLSRAACSERMLIMVGSTETGFAITGLARDGFAQDNSLLKIRAPTPGCLEVWLGNQRLLEYAYGHVQTPPEDLLLSTGYVREKLLAVARDTQSPPGYLEAVSSIVRQLAEHSQGGILVLSAKQHPYIPPSTSFALEPDSHLSDLLRHLAWRPNELFDETSEVLRQGAVRAEIERTIAEIGRMTALDGATVLDRSLAVRGFGIILPVIPDIRVTQAMDHAATLRRPFPLEQYGARHRAASSYAWSNPGSLVFIASESGDIGCLLRESDGDQVLMWRFRAADLSSSGP